MTQVAELPLPSTPRSAETRFVYQHLLRAFRQPLLHPAARAAVHLHQGRLRRELYRARPCAHRVQRRLDGGADAGRLPGRPLERALHAGRGPAGRRRRVRDRGARQFVLGVPRDVRGRGPRQHRLPPGRLRAARTACSGRAHRTRVLLPHLRGHARQRGRAGDAGLSLRRHGMARRVPVRRRARRRGRARRVPDPGAAGDR